MPPQLQQLAMSAAFNDFSLVQHHDPVRIDDGGQPVGDHQRGALGGDPIEGALDRGFRFVVHRGGGLRDAPCQPFVSNPTQVFDGVFYFAFVTTSSGQFCKFFCQTKPCNIGITAAPPMSRLA